MDSNASLGNASRQPNSLPSSCLLKAWVIIADNKENLLRNGTIFARLLCASTLLSQVTYIAMLLLLRTPMLTLITRYSLPKPDRL